MKLPINKAAELANACAEVTKDTAIAFKVRYAIGRTLAELKIALTTYQESREEIISRHSGGKDTIEKDHKNFSLAVEELTALDKDEITFTEHKFTEEEFLSKEPALSGNTIAVLVTYLMEQKKDK